MTVKCEDEVHQCDKCKWSIYGTAGFAGIRGYIWDGHELNSTEQPDQVG